MHYALVKKIHTIVYKKKLAKQNFLSEITLKEDIINDYEEIIDCMSYINIIDWKMYTHNDEKCELILNILYDFIQGNDLNELHKTITFNLFNTTEPKDLLTSFKKLQLKTYKLLTDKDNIEENYQNLLQLLEDLNITMNKHKFLLFLSMIGSMLSVFLNNEYGCFKIGQILKKYANDIKQLFGTEILVDIFGKNKKMLLLLVENGIITVDTYFINFLINNPYDSSYFLYFSDTFLKNIDTIDITVKRILLQKTESFWIKYINESEENESDFNDESETIKNILTNITKTDNFKEKRIKGFNDNYICELIRTDNVEKFCSYTVKNKINLNSKIEESIFETNLVLIEEEPLTLIEYAIVYGAIKIYDFLIKNDVNVSATMLKFTACSTNTEIFNGLFEKCMNSEKINIEIEKALITAIKCHNDALILYIINNKLIKYNIPKVIMNLLMYHNFILFDNEFVINASVNKSQLLLILNEYKYYLFIELFVMNSDFIDKCYYDMITLLNGFKSETYFKDENKERFSTVFYFLDNELNGRTLNIKKISKLLQNVDEIPIEQINKINTSLDTYFEENDEQILSIKQMLYQAQILNAKHLLNNIADSIEKNMNYKPLYNFLIKILENNYCTKTFSKAFNQSHRLFLEKYPVEYTWENCLLKIRCLFNTNEFNTSNKTSDEIAEEEEDLLNELYEIFDDNVK